MNTANPIETQIKRRIRSHGRGWCFTPQDHSDLGPNTAIRKALSRMVREGFIRRLAHGVYDYPRKHKVLGLLPPSIEAVAKAISKRDHLSIHPSGAFAANLLGLSEQIPGKVIFLIEGHSRKLKIGKNEIILKKTSPRNMAMANTKTGLVVEGLRHVGKQNINESVIRKVHSRLTRSDLKDLRNNSRYAPLWIQKIILDLVKESK